MIPTVSTPNTFAFPQYFSDDETLAAAREVELFSEPDTGALDNVSETNHRSLLHRRRFHTSSHDLDLASNGWPTLPSPDELHAAYASLPSSPVVRETPAAFRSSPSPAPPSVRVKKEEEDEKNIIMPPLLPQPERLSLSLWDYLREELLATDFDSHQELKWERVSNFLGVPLALERVSLRSVLVYSPQP